MEFTHFGRLIGEGSERFCYENPDNPDTCYKISKSGTSIQTIREIKYFNFLEKRGIYPSFFPKFYGTFKLGNQIVLEQEYLKSNTLVKAAELRQYITQASEDDFPRIENILNETKREMIRMNVIVSDIRTGNIVLLFNPDKTINRLVFVDGFGSPEFIPLPIYCPFFGRKKIERQWKKFMKKYEMEKKLRLEQLHQSTQR